MKNRNDWDFPDVEGDFSLVDDLEILDTGNFDLVDVDISNGPDKTNEESTEFESIFEDDEKVGGEVIEPSTLVDQNLMAEDEAEEKVEAEESGKEETFSEEIKETEGEEVSEATFVSESQVESPAQTISDEVSEEAVQITREETSSEEPSVEIVEIVEEVNLDERGEEEMAEKFKVEELTSILKNLLDVSPDFQGSALVSTDGFVIASVLPEGTSEEKVGAMSAAILSLGERASSELNKGKLSTVFVEGEDGYAIITSVTDNVLLLLSTTKYAKLGLVFYELSSVKGALKEYFEK